MTFLDKLRTSELFRRDPGVTGAWQVIGWWEMRRIPYNLLLGIAGVVSVAVSFLAAAVIVPVVGDPRPDPPLFLLVAAFGVVANVLYSGGWMMELVWRRLWPAGSARLAVQTFGLGLLLSVMVALLPAVGAVAYALYVILARNPRGLP